MLIRQPAAGPRHEVEGILAFWNFRVWQKGMEKIPHTCQIRDAVFAPQLS